MDRKLKKTLANLAAVPCAIPALFTAYCALAPQNWTPDIDLNPYLALSVASLSSYFVLRIDTPEKRMLSFRERQRKLKNQRRIEIREFLEQKRLEEERQDYISEEMSKIREIENREKYSEECLTEPEEDTECDYT